jgi:hypothetical protein
VLTANTPAVPGIGSQYASANFDSGGEAPEGNKTYRLSVLPDVPVKDFWSVVGSHKTVRFCDCETWRACFAWWRILAFFRCRGLEHGGTIPRADTSTPPRDHHRPPPGWLFDGD